MILALDTATQVCSVALGEKGKMVAHFALQDPKAHSRAVEPMIKAVMDMAGVRLQDLLGIAVAAGPGSYTGLRIGMTAAKALAQVADIPVVPVSTLAAFAAIERAEDILVCAALDARQGRVFAGAYLAGQNVLADTLADAKSVMDAIKQLGFSRGCFVGNGASVCIPLAEAIGLYCVKARSDGATGLAAGVLQLGEQLLYQGKAVSCWSAQPYYLAKSEPERKLAIRFEEEA
jgi:tRNA threonylcarbamoyladenosine biosynthesis protein TsaB